MRAVIMDAPHQIRVGEWETPRPGPDEVLISVAAAGICAGDMYFYLGKNPYAVYPQICGHEVAGMVAEVGEGVQGFATGQAVVIEPFLGCGKCYPCRVGKSNCCMNLRIIGVHQPGGYAEYVKSPAHKVFKFPSGLGFPAASAVEPVAIGVQACRRGAIQRGEYVLVLGCGPIGLALIEVARARGAHIVAADILPERLTLAAQLGAETLPADDKLLSRVLEQTSGEGAAVVVEATGNPRAMELTPALVAAGGRIVVLGLLPQGVGVTFPGLDFTRKEMTIVGSRASVGCFPEALELMAAGAITYPRLATEYDLWDAPRVFEHLAAHPGEVLRAVLIRG